MEVLMDGFFEKCPVSWAGAIILQVHQAAYGGSGHMDDL